MVEQTGNQDRAYIQSVAESLLPEIPAIVARFMSKEVRAIVEPDDVAQGVASEFLKSVAPFEPRTADIKGDLRALVSAISRHQVIDWSRKLKSFIPTLDHVLIENVKRDGHTPSRVLAKGESLATVSECLKKLDQGAREILWRRHGEDQTFATIAEALGLTEGQVDGRYRRALKELHDLVGSTQNQQFDSSNG